MLPYESSLKNMPWMETLMKKLGNTIAAGFLTISISAEGIIKIRHTETSGKTETINSSIPVGLPVEEHTDPERTENPVPYMRTQIAMAPTTQSPP
jgi:hypothetical protein